MNIQDTIVHAGYFLIFLTIFIESGLFIGFVLPGDTLLLSLGVGASTGKFSLLIVFLVAISAAILGDIFGYYFGKRFGPSLFSRQTSGFFRKENLTKAHAFYQKYGSTTVLLARFAPVFRTFAPIVAGVSEMEVQPFMLYNVLGAFLWVIGVTLIGYFLGTHIPAAYLDRFVLVFGGGAVVISLASAIWHFRSSK